MPRLLARAHHDDPPALHTGYVTTAVSAVALTAVSFTSPTHALVVLALVLGTLGVATGLVSHVLVRRAHRHRNARHRDWADSFEGTSLLEFREDLEARDRAIDDLDRSWAAPLGVSFALVVSALVVPWELIAPLAPSPDVDVLTTWWLAVSLSAAAVCVVLSAVAGVRSEGGDRVLEHEDA